MSQIETPIENIVHSSFAQAAEQHQDNLAEIRLPLNGQRASDDASGPTDRSKAQRDADEKVTNLTLPIMEIVPAGQTVRETVKLDGQDRQYFLHMPKDYDPTKSYPLVLVYNGWGNHPGQGGVPGGAEGMEKTTGMSERADTDNFIVAYMDGSPRDQHSWNNGEWFFSKENDIKFTTQTMDNIAKVANVDQSRIYLAGYSQGGSFAHRAATELPDRIAAVATVGGWLTGLEQKPKEPVSVLEIHADQDPTVPYDGRFMWTTMKPHSYLTNFYKEADFLAGAPTVEEIATADATKAYSETWKNPNSGTEVKMITLPGVNRHEYYGGFGATVSPINVTDQFLNFFKDHQRIANH